MNLYKYFYHNLTHRPVPLFEDAVYISFYGTDQYEDGDDYSTHE